MAALECLRGEFAAGLSLVVYEGGGVDEIVARAEGRSVAALYALAGGEYVSHILPAPQFAHEPFRELFADGLSTLTPRVARSDPR